MPKNHNVNKNKNIINIKIGHITKKKRKHKKKGRRQHYGDNIVSSNVPYFLTPTNKPAYDLTSAQDKENLKALENKIMLANSNALEAIKTKLNSFQDITPIKPHSFQDVSPISRNGYSNFPTFVDVDDHSDAISNFTSEPDRSIHWEAMTPHSDMATNATSMTSYSSSYNSANDHGRYNQAIDSFLEHEQQAKADLYDFYPKTPKGYNDLVSKEEENTNSSDAGLEELLGESFYEQATAAASVDASTHEQTAATFEDVNKEGSKPRKPYGKPLSDPIAEAARLANLEAKKRSKTRKTKPEAVGVELQRRGRKPIPTPRNITVSSSMMQPKPTK